MSRLPTYDPTLPTGGTNVLNEDQQEIFAQVNRFARRELHPLQERMDNEEWWPEHVFPEFGRHGYLGVTAPTAFGGVALDTITPLLISQALGRWNPAIALSYLAHENLCLNNIVANADDDIQARYVPGLCSGELVGALALTEPGAGSDALGGMRTSAVRDGDDYVLNGTKLYITNGPIADVVLVYAKTDPALGAKGISAFVVESSTPGFAVAQKLIKMGLRGSQTAELVFEDCRVPSANLVGTENDGVAVVMNGLDIERIGLSFMILGMAERALQLTIEYARAREQFGQPIGSFQLVQGMVADMYTQVEALRSMALDVAIEADTVPHGAAPQRMSLRAASLCLLAGTTYMQVADKAVQVHGGSGFMWETEVNRLYRAGKLLEIGAGTNEVRRVIIARQLLGR
jgi:isovaleryl-CoA dehydrogenase